MKALVSLLRAFAVLLVVSGCGSASTHHSADSQPVTGQEQAAQGKIFSARIVNWEAGPEVSGDTLDDINNTCVIEITRADGQTPKSLTVVDVFPYMKVHGHGAPDEQITTSVEGPRIRVAKIAFTMSGPWELHVKATVDGQTEELEIPIRVP